MTSGAARSYPSVAKHDTTAEHKNRALEMGLRLTATGSCPRRLVGKPHRHAGRTPV
jgi:hypothetical protein